MVNRSFNPDINKHGQLCETFLTWGDFLSYVEQRLSPAYKKSGRDENTGAVRYDWNLPALEDTVKLARYGWKDGEALAESFAHSIEGAIAPSIMREDWNYDVEGMAFDVARYVEGEPEHWVRVEDSTMAAGSRHFKLTLNCSVVAVTGREGILRRGAAAAALVRLLEFSGRQVEVWVINGVRGKLENREKATEPSYIMSVRVKEYDQPLDMSRVAFALAHEGMLRRLAWAVKDQVPDNWLPQVGYDAGYGASKDPSVTEGIYIGSYDGAFPDAASAERWIRQTLEEQGVRLRK